MTGTSHYLHIIQLNRELCGSQVGCRPYLAAGESSAAALGFRGVLFVVILQLPESYERGHIS